MKPILTGITGGIGSGKSIVSRVLRELGYPVYDADTEAKLLLAGDAEIIAAVKALIGDEAYLPDGTPDRAYISSVVFGDKTRLQKLNDIIHPAVAEHFKKWVTMHADSKLLFKEAAVMFESGSAAALNHVVAVTSSREIRIRRVIKRDGKTREQIEQIMASQMPENELLARCHFEIKNDEKHPVLMQVMKLLETLDPKPTENSTHKN
jgi:dephospho-CoA kinase